MAKNSRSSEDLPTAARTLGEALRGFLRFAAPVAYVYNPLDYAWPVHEAYLARFGRGPKRVVFLGMTWDPRHGPDRGAVRGKWRRCAGGWGCRGR